MLKQQIYRFYIKTAIFILAVFLFNYLHQIQQGTYEFIFVPLAQNLLDGNGYTFYLFNGGPATYPLWGFTFQILAGLPAGLHNVGVLLSNFLMALIGVHYFYRLFPLTPRFYHNFLFIPFYALMSVKWPDAAAGAMMIPAVFYAKNYFQKRELIYAVYSGIFLGIVFNFRSEYIYFPLFLIIFAIPFFKRVNYFSIVKYAVISGFIAFLLILPWTLRQYSLTGEFSPSATNGGAVAYISLGQLPGNLWGIEPVDKTAFEYVRKNGVENPYSPEGNKLLINHFIELVQSKPIEYVYKLLNNFIDAFTGGVYTGEFSALMIENNRFDEINKVVAEMPTVIDKIEYIRELPINESLPIIIEKAIRLLFIVVFIALMMNVFFGSINKLKIHYIYFLIIAVVVYKLLIVSSLQYEYRHMNQIYMFVLGLAMLNIDLKLKQVR